MYLQQFAFKPATNENIKPIAGLRPATFLVAGLLEHGCKFQFEWDENKNQLNQQKHGIGFEEAKEIFLGNVFTSISEKIDYGQIREVRIGAI